MCLPSHVAFGEFIRAIPIEDLEGQPLVGIPMSLVKAAPKHALAEFDQPDPDVLILHLVDPKSRSASSHKRCKVVSHRGTHWTSIPKKYWLNDRGASVGDLVEVFWTPQKDGLALHLKRISEEGAGSESHWVPMS